MLVGSVSDLFAKTFIRLSGQCFSGRFHLFTIRLLIYGTFTWLALYTVDELMSSITIPFTVEIVVALLLFLLEIAFDDEKMKK